MALIDDYGRDLKRELRGDERKYSYHEFCRECKQKHMRYTDDYDYRNDVCRRCGSSNLRRQINAVTSKVTQKNRSQLIHEHMQKDGMSYKDAEEYCWDVY